MTTYFIRRLGILFVTFLGVTILAFGLIRMVPGDPILVLLGERGASPEVYNAMKKKLGLDKPLWQQYGNYLGDTFQGNLGTSIISKRPVKEEFFGRFPATLELGLSAIIFAILFGIPLGILAAVKKNTVFDYLFMGGSLVGYSMPIFWWGLLLILFFSVNLGWLPVAGRIGLEYDVEMYTGFMLIDVFGPDNEGWPAFWDACRHLLLPTIAMGTIPLAIFARMTRSSMLEILGEDYIRTAKAKGLSTFKVVGVHGLRNALIPIVTVIGLMVGSIVTGAILTETIFSWPGIGKWIFNSILSRDYPVIQGGILCIATIIIVLNMVIDVLYAVINPKIRVN